MNNPLMLNQKRLGFQVIINENPTTINILTYPLIDNGTGLMVPNPYGTPVTTSAIVRIAHEKRGPVDDEANEAGLSTNLSRFILANYNTTLTQGQTIQYYEGRSYKVGKVDPLSAFGGLYGYQAPLIEGNYE